MVEPGRGGKRCRVGGRAGTEEVEVGAEEGDDGAHCVEAVRCEGLKG